MKKITLALLAIGACIFTAEAQENKTIKEVSTVKREVKREGSQVIVKEVEKVEQVKGAIIVSDSEEENQFFKEDATKVDDENKVIVDKVTIDEENEALIAAEKKRQEEELIRSQIEAKARAEAQRKILEQQKKERMDALEKNRARLEKRSKGTGKLKKKKNNY